MPNTWSARLGWAQASTTAEKPPAAKASPKPAAVILRLRSGQALRRAQVEAARTAVEIGPYWKAQFQRLLRHKHKNQAIVAIARRLLIAVWHVFSERVADKNAVPGMVAFKLMMWSWKLSDHERGGLTTRHFVRYHLIRLNLDHDLSYLITCKNTKRAIASAEEVLALKPELSTAG